MVYFILNTQFFCEVQQELLNNSVLKLWNLNRKRTDILDEGEPTLDVGEQTVGETTRRRNDRYRVRCVPDIVLLLWGEILSYSLFQGLIWSIVNHPCSLKEFILSLWCFSTSTNDFFTISLYWKTIRFRLLPCLFVCLIVFFLCVCVCVCVCVYVPFYLSFYLSVYLVWFFGLLRQDFLKAEIFSLATSIWQSERGINLVLFFSFIA